MDDALAQTFEQRAHPFEHRRVAAGHDRQRGVDGALGAAGNRGVEHVDALLGELRGNPAGGLGGDGRTVDQHRAGRHAFDQAILAEGDSLDIGARGDDGEHHFAAATQFGRCDIDGGRQPGGAFRPPRPDEQFLPGALQMQRHRAPHGAEADETDLHS